MIRTQQPDNPISRIDFALNRLDFAPGITVIADPQNDATAVADPFGIYALIADAGPVTALELASHLGLHLGHVQPWLKWQSAIGYLHRDEFGRYATSCPWPRVGF